MNDQRKVIFEDRRKMMAQESLEPTIAEMRAGVIDDIVAKHIPHDAYPEAWDIAGLKEEVTAKLNLDLPVDAWAKEEGIADEEMAERLHKAADEAYAERVERNTPEAMRYVEKQVILQTLDHLWRDHLVTLDHLRQVIGWRGMAQRDPLNEYKSEAFELFQQLIAQWHEAVIAQMMRIEVRFQAPEPDAAADAVPASRSEHRPERGDVRRPLRADRRARSSRRRGQLVAAPARRGSPSATPTIPRPGARSAATSPAPAVRARSSSIATGSSPDGDAPTAGPAYRRRDQPRGGARRADRAIRRLASTRRSARRRLALRGGRPSRGRPDRRAGRAARRRRGAARGVRGAARGRRAAVAHPRAARVLEPDVRDLARRARPAPRNRDDRRGGARRTSPRAAAKPLRVLDLGVGSGALLCALLARVSATRRASASTSAAARRRSRAPIFERCGLAARGRSASATGARGSRGRST